MFMETQQNDIKHVEKVQLRLTWTPQFFVPVQVIDHPLCCVLVGPPVRDGGPQVPMSRCSLGVVGQDDLVTRRPETPQGQDWFLWRAGEAVESLCRFCIIHQLQEEKTNLSGAEF